jgi:hypothetical protein
MFGELTKKEVKKTIADIRGNKAVIARKQHAPGRVVMPVLPQNLKQKEPLKKKKLE